MSVKNNKTSPWTDKKLIESSCKLGESYVYSLKAEKSGAVYAISKIKMLCNLRFLKARLRLLCNKLSTAQQPEPRFKTAEVI